MAMRIRWMASVVVLCGVAACGGDERGQAATAWTGVVPLPAGSDGEADTEETEGDSTGGEGDDSGANEGGSETGGNASDPGPASQGDPTGASASAGDTGNDTSGDPVLDACLEVAQDACEQCGCNQCLDPLYACEMDEGCVAMRECAQASGCTDATSCYEACEGVIDMYGGILGDSADLALDLSECLDASCPVCF